MKKTLLTLLCAGMLLQGTVAFAQSNENRGRNNNNAGGLNRLLDILRDDNSGQNTTDEEVTEEEVPAQTPTTTTPEPEPVVPAPVTPTTPVRTPRDTTPPVATTTTPVVPPQNPTTPEPGVPGTSVPLPITSGGESADPAVLAAQNSSPTAGAGNVYRGNALPADVTQLLLLMACVLGVGGMVLTENKLVSRTIRLLAPVQTARYGA